MSQIGRIGLGTYPAFNRHVSERQIGQWRDAGLQDALSGGALFMQMKRRQKKHRRRPVNDVGMLNAGKELARRIPQQVASEARFDQLQTHRTPAIASSVLKSPAMSERCSAVLRLRLKVLLVTTLRLTAGAWEETCAPG